MNIGKIRDFKPRIFRWNFFRDLIAYFSSIILILPSVIVMFLLKRGHLFTGLIGVVIWLPLLGIIVMQLHKQGVMRLGMSLPLVTISTAVLALIFIIS